MREYLNKEISNGSIIGPFHTNPFGNEARFSPLDTQPKKDSPELRIILNLSYPFRGHSVNSSIDTGNFCGTPMDLKYPTPDDLAKIVLKKGKNARIFKRDLKKCYRQFFMDPASIALLGYLFQGEIYFDVTLSMGSRSTAYCCQRTTNCITFIFQKHGFEDVNYLDDLGAADTIDRAETAFRTLGQIIYNIGMQEVTEKAQAPAPIATFLGILYNTISMTMEITPDRLQELKNLLDRWFLKREASPKEIQQLLGKLNFTCSTVRAGCIFVSKIINALRGSPDKIILSEEFCKDINWWRIYMAEFDGISMIPDLKWKAPDTVLQIDACLEVCGAWAEPVRKFFHTKFPGWMNNNKNICINEKETFTLILTLKVWGELVTNKHILVYCDNRTMGEIVNTGQARNTFAQNCLWEICYLAAKSNAMVKTIFKPGQENQKADFLSRWDKKYAKLFKEATANYNTQEVQITDDMFEFSSDW